MLVKFAKKVSAWTVVAAFSGLSLTAVTNQQVVGKVVRSSGASLSGAAIPDEGTIIAGDALTTAKGGSALVKLAATTQASLGEGTTVLFQRDDAGLSAKVSSGTLLVETGGADAPLVEAAEYQTWPDGHAKANYLVAVLPDKTIVITARRGGLSIKDRDSGRTYMLHEGYKAVSANNSGAVSSQETEEPKQAPSIPAGPKTQTPPPKKMSKTLIIVLAAGGAGGIAAAVAASGGGAPASPSGP